MRFRPDCARSPGAPQAPKAPRAARSPRVLVHASQSYIGLGVAEIDAERAKALNLKEERGVEVKSVTENSPAAKAGIKTGDMVLEYNGQRVEGMDQFSRLVRETPRRPHRRPADLAQRRRAARDRHHRLAPRPYHPLRR